VPHIYTTDAFILKSLPSRETNKSYFLFSNNLGLIKASAQGIRAPQSKLKGHLEDYCFSRISLVKGREVWRITNVETVVQKPFVRDLDKLSVVKKVFDLLLRLIHGEEKNEALFSVIETFYRYISNNEVSGDGLKNLEALVVLRILHSLGYLKESPDISGFASSPEISSDMLKTFDSKRLRAVKDINQVLTETHL
jgi:DNA repair protein RecO (recombination protein O)